jgi:ubiquinone/menaquinone biosynthesis C-methylase UbiE
VTDNLAGAQADTIKTCCAALYESDWARLLLGESFHPGGLSLTERLGELLDLGPGKRLLDVASGQGTSAIFLAQHFGCEVVGVDYGSWAVAEARGLVEDEGKAGRVRFEQGDAECLHFDDETFDAIICECAFCVFPDKAAAAAEFARVLRPDGRVGLSDLTRAGPLPSELESLLAWVACIADARPVEEYVSYLEGVGLAVNLIESHDSALSGIVESIRAKLLGAELLVKLKKVDLPGVDLEQAKALARSAAEAVQQGQLGYAVLLATKCS